MRIQNKWRPLGAMVVTKWGFCGSKFESRHRGLSGGVEGPLRLALTRFPQYSSVTPL